MGIINKPFTFVGGATKTGEASQVNAVVDALYNLVNGGVDDANISATANIQQSKVNSLVTDMAARLLKGGDTMTGSLAVKTTFPQLRLIGTDSTNRDWRIVTSGFGSFAGTLFIQRNDGTELAPVWADIYRLNVTGVPVSGFDLTTKLYVDQQVAAAQAIAQATAFGKTTKTNGNFTSGAGAGFNEVTDLFVAINTRGSTRARISYIGNVSNDSVTAEAVYVSLQVDFANQGGANGLTTVYSDNNKPGNASFSFVTDGLSLGSHSFGIIQRSQTGNATMHCNASHPAIIIAEELATGF